MIDLKVAVRTTVLLVDDDIQQLELHALTMKMSGFAVVTASSPVQAISILKENCHRIDVAVIDHYMPGMNGCVLAQYLKTSYPGLNTVVYTGALDIKEDDMVGVDVFVSKNDDIDYLLAKVAELGRVDPLGPNTFALQSHTCMAMVN